MYRPRTLPAIVSTATRAASPARPPHFVTRGSKKTAPTRHKIPSLPCNLQEHTPRQKCVTGVKNRVTGGAEKALPTCHPISMPVRKPQKQMNLGWQINMRAPQAKYPSPPSPGAPPGGTLG
ncbi:exported hypothetical protein [Candidatus Sulfopaludibacter sp. SbA4]|nr:exported hypothetical protein [Candidatus Sulfopaludibacter sp. SbA4]